MQGIPFGQLPRKSFVLSADISYAAVFM